MMQKKQSLKKKVINDPYIKYLVDAIKYSVNIDSQRRE